MYLASIGLLFAGYVIGGSFHGYGAGIGVQDGKMRHGSQVAGLAYGTRVNEYGLFLVARLGAFCLIVNFKKMWKMGMAGKHIVIGGIGRGTLAGGDAVPVRVFQGAVDGKAFFAVYPKFLHGVGIHSVCDVTPGVFGKDRPGVLGALAAAVGGKAAVVLGQHDQFVVAAEGAKDGIGEIILDEVDYLIGVHAVVNEVAQEKGGGDAWMLGSLLKNRLQGGEIGVDIRKNEQAHNVASLESVVCMGRVSSFFLGGCGYGGMAIRGGTAVGDGHTGRDGCGGMAIRGGTAVGGWPYGTLRQQGFIGF